MRKQPNRIAIGLLILIGLGFLVGIIGKYVWEKYKQVEGGDMIVMYFDESIKGLNVGSSVVFKGVEIGKVAKIDLVSDADNMTFIIPVYARLENNQKINSFDKELRGDSDKMISAFIEKGLRARLVTQSIITGQLMVELEMLPNTKIHLKQTKKMPHVHEIPTILSQMGELSKGLQNIPISETMQNINETLQHLNGMLVPLIQMSEHLNTVVTLHSGEVLGNFNKTLFDISDAARALRNFLDYLERHPEALLKGKGGNR